MDLNDHIRKATKNLNFLNSFFKKILDSNDWAVTVSFYTAVHIVEAVIFKNKKVRFNGQEYSADGSETIKKLLDQGRIPLPLLLKNTTHEVRKAIVIENFSVISTEYIMLHNDSFQARYYQYNIADWQIEMTVQQAVPSILAWAKKELEVDLPDPFTKVKV